MLFRSVHTSWPFLMSCSCMHSLVLLLQTGQTLNLCRKCPLSPRTGTAVLPPQECQNVHLTVTDNKYKGVIIIVAFL